MLGLAHDEDGPKSTMKPLKAICALLDEIAPSAAGPRERLITFVADRPGHDRRYAIDPSKLERELGISAGLIWGACAEATVVYTDRGISKGMDRGMRLGFSKNGLAGQISWRTRSAAR